MQGNDAARALVQVALCQLFLRRTLVDVGHMDVEVVGTTIADLQGRRNSFTICNDRCSRLYKLR